MFSGSDAGLIGDLRFRQSEWSNPAIEQETDAAVAGQAVCADILVIGHIGKRRAVLPNLSSPEPMPELF